MLLHDGANLTRVETDHRKPWATGEDRSTSDSSGDGYSVPWLTEGRYPGESTANGDTGIAALSPVDPAVNALPKQTLAMSADEPVVNAATRETEKTQPKPKNDAGVDKNRSEPKKTVIDSVKLRHMANETKRQMPENDDRRTRETWSDSMGPTVVELGDDEQSLAPEHERTDAEMTQDISEEEFERLLPRLQPHLERLKLRDDSGKKVPVP
ncbi:hypothetical protein IL306_000050 [Fusarium sp. DS 682]|nr:hypothetical protein IL306_000050 [Fusarium sp. DS 682]